MALSQTKIITKGQDSYSNVHLLKSSLVKLGILQLLLYLCQNGEMAHECPAQYSGWTPLALLQLQTCEWGGTKKRKSKGIWIIPPLDDRLPMSPTNISPLFPVKKQTVIFLSLSLVTNTNNYSYPPVSSYKNSHIHHPVSCYKYKQVRLFPVRNIYTSLFPTNMNSYSNLAI